MKYVLVLVLAVLSYTIFMVRQDVQALNDKLAHAEIRIDVCYNETAAVQDRVEAQVAELRFDLETLQLVLGIHKGVASEQ